MMYSVVLVIISIVASAASEKIFGPKLGKFLYDQNNERIVTSRSCDCGNSLTRIIGGSETTKNEYPWMVALCMNTPCKYTTFHCGGTLINKLYVVTAAHCVHNINMTRMAVSLGDYDLNSPNETLSVERKVAQITIHKNYNPKTLLNDIALLKLESPIIVSDQIRPICLPTISRNQPTYENEIATVIGWGSTNPEGSIYPTILREVEVQIISQNTCFRKYNGVAAITVEMLCAASTGKDSCYGDSGGSLAIKDAVGRWQIIGVVSFGVNCADSNYPGVYTRITKYLDWLNQNMDPSVQC